MKNSRLNYIRKKKFHELTRCEIHDLRYVGILNGFGGASQSSLVRWFIGWILADFDKAIPDYHDFGYFIGGDEKRRKECDEKFYRAMLADIMSRYSTGMIGKWELTWKSFVALGAYTAIRWKGSKYFNYS